ncbi:MAG TPA: C45 family autoproteolytic acyltransferase/hydrolase [Candidatus Binatia bacterium]|jgi:hypothetical protein|nr:C45 family autoproteolytic acyltransferase/hydrolase [Candidatus Binatia bacterium]
MSRILFALHSRRILFSAALLLASQGLAAPVSSGQQRWLAKAGRFERHGWIYLHLEGEAEERGFQHGYLLAPEIADCLRTTRVSWKHETSMTWSWLVEHADAMFTPKIDAENLAELDGIAEGMRAAGHPTTRDELIAYNGIIELADYWWPTELKKIKDGPTASVPESCSSFIATGSLTRDGNVVLGHNTMMSYYDPFPNVIADIAPAHGHRILWQTQPGWIHSGTDFFITDAGLVGSETTIGDFEGFETNGVPEFVRMRRATQDAGSIDQWCEIMRRENNGGYANAWLLGDINTREIARLELGRKQIGFEKKRDGCFTGSNVAEDLKLLRFETNAKETDIRQSSVARRVRWKQLMKQYAGRIDVALAKDFESDHFDSYLEKARPGSRTLCGHFELERDPSGSWPGVPFGCAGTVDAKVVDASMAKKMSFAARWGCACGRAFDAQEYLTAHPQFDWMKDILKTRLAQPWTQFRTGETGREPSGRME